MPNLVPFNYHDKQVRTISKDGEPWFVAKDVCEILGHTNSRVAVERLDSDEKGVSKVYTLGGEQDMTVINESGLYSLVLTSNKPEAKEFKRWVTHEVIPSIRKTGQYIAKPVSALEALAQTVQDNWRQDIRHKLNKISQAIGPNKFQEVRSESYKLLEQRAGVLLERRLDNLKTRLLKEGISKSKIDKAGKIDVIDQDKKLREIYGKIVSEYLIRYVA